MTQKPIADEIIRGWWKGDTASLKYGDRELNSALSRVTAPVFLLNDKGRAGIAQKGVITIGKNVLSGADLPLSAYIPPLLPSDLGDPYFKKRHGLQYAYVAGAMANGITSVQMVEAAGNAGMIGFFGAAGLPLSRVEEAIDCLQKSMKDRPFGFNLIHSPNDPDLESALVDLYLRRGINLVSASAYLGLTLPLVYYRIKGIHIDNTGTVRCPNKIVAKVSRVEIAEKFFSPPPEKLLSALIEKNLITPKEAELAASIPMADDLTAEADSGGHTDNRPAITLLPTMLALRNKIVLKYQYKKPICVGLGGGIATPESAAAAFAMGAAYIVTGTINQACVEADTSELVRQMLAEARQADVTMAPAADMFEMGVKVQVLKRGTMFPFRASKLYALYNQYESLDKIPENQRTMLEKNFFKHSLQEEWEETKKYFADQDPKQVVRAEKDAKHKMALVFRSYLGRSSMWSITGDPLRKIDFQIWCSPAIGAFNEWVKGSFLEKIENRKTVTIAMNLLMGASVSIRGNWLKSQGAILHGNTGHFAPSKYSEIQDLLENR